MLDAFVNYCKTAYPAVYNGTADIWTTIGSTRLDAWVDAWVASGGDTQGNPMGGFPGGAGGGQAGGGYRATPPNAEVPPEGAPIEYQQWSGMRRLWWRMTHGKAEWWEYLLAVGAVVLVFVALRWMWRTMTKKGRSGRGKRRARRQRNRQRFSRSMKLR